MEQWPLHLPKALRGPVHSYAASVLVSASQVPPALHQTLLLLITRTRLSFSPIIVHARGAPAAIREWSWQPGQQAYIYSSTCLQPLVMFKQYHCLWHSIACMPFAVILNIELLTTVKIVEAVL